MCRIEVDARTSSSLGATMGAAVLEIINISSIRGLYRTYSIGLQGNKRRQARPPDTPDTKQASFYHGYGLLMSATTDVRLICNVCLYKRVI